MHEQVHDLKRRVEAALASLDSPDSKALPPIESLAAELRGALQQFPDAGQELGPLLRRLASRPTAPLAAELVHWESVAGGYLAIGHRPKLKTIPALRQAGVTHVVTLLAESEGADAIGAVVQRVGIAWHWFPLASATPPGADGIGEIRELFDALRAALADGGKIFVHCSAGIHRTGMIAFGLLRSAGLSRPEALAKLRLLRTETGDGVGTDRLAWGDQFADDRDG